MRYVLEFGAFLPHALPEIIMAIGALLLALFVLPKFIPLYGSVWLIAIVYVISRLAFATRALNSSLLQIHKELEEAAYTAGLSPVRTSWRILVPLLRPTLMSIWIWSAILVYRELTVAVSYQSGKHYFAGGDLELLVFRRHQSGGGGDVADDARADAAHSNLLVVRAPPADAGIVSFVEIAQRTRLIIYG